MNCGSIVGVKMIVGTNRPYSVLLSTLIMQRAQHLKTSSEIIFIDFSSSCDVTQTAVTLVLTASKAGAVPLAVLLHGNQSQLRCVCASPIIGVALLQLNRLTSN